MLMPAITQLRSSLVCFCDSIYPNSTKCFLLDDIVNTFFLATTSYAHRFIKVKEVAFIVARATIKPRIISLP